MKKRDKSELTISRKIVIILLCIVLNMAGRMLAGAWKLPLWLDTIGTSVAACFLGIGGALVVGFSGSLLS